jgi:hypothetical protein
MKLVDWRMVRPVIQAFFFDGWKHKRVEFELTEAERISAAGRKGGRESGRVRRERSLNGRSTKGGVSLNEKGNDSSTIGEALHSPSQEDDERDARAKPPLVSENASKLADACLQAIGENPRQPPVELCGLAYQAQVWIERGYVPASVVAVFARIGKSKPINYFARAVENEMSRPPPSPPSANVHVLSPHGAANVASVTRRIAEEWAAEQAADGGQASGDSDGVLSQGRCG